MKFIRSVLIAVTFLAALPLCAADDDLPAEKAWKAFRDASKPPTPPKEWRTQRPTEEAIEAWKRTESDRLRAAAKLARDFFTQFPDDPNAKKAREREMDLLSQVLAFGSPEDREAGARALVKDNPQDARAWRGLLESARGDDKKTLVLAREILASKTAPNAVKDEAEALITKFEALGKPVDIRFTATDGREVDLAKLKGKVVLIDFWATWCGPCVAEVPGLVKSYERLHPQGFEIVGISLDQSDAPLKKFIGEKKMTWPQYFEKGGKIQYARRFGISAIPTMWLVDKQGNLRDMNARGTLEEKVEKLLKE